MKPYLLVSYLLLGACASMPPAIKNARVVNVSYSQASQSIDSYQDVPVRWGGVIIDVENEENFSLVQTLLYPLDDVGRPRLDESSGGRFVIKNAEFLDPVVYAKDKEITVVGTLNGEIERMVEKESFGCRCYYLRLFTYGRNTRMIIMDMDMAMVDMGIGLTLDIMAIPFSGEDTEDTTEDTIGHIGTSRADTNFRTVS